MIFYLRFQKQINVSMAISTNYIYRDRHDTNFKNSRFTEADKHNEEYLGLLDGSRTIAPEENCPQPQN